MKWTEFNLLSPGFAKTMGLKGSILENQDAILDGAEMLFPDDDGLTQSTTNDLYSEFRWLEAGRPYYDVYPAVVPAFLHVDLSKVSGSQLRLPLRTLLLRFAVDHVVHGVDTILVTVAKREIDGRDVDYLRIIVVFSSITVTDDYGGRGRIFAELSLEDTTPLEEVCSTYTLTDHNHVSPNESTELLEGIRAAWRVVAAICMLGDNPDLIEPQPLAADIDKWNKTHDPRLIEKAERRGKRAWSVGKHIEVAPGFRRPHFAIRWCGKGGTDPRLRPVKGCLVRKKAITEVPTGFLDELQERGDV